jgi:hypothetical protein
MTMLIDLCVSIDFIDFWHAYGEQYLKIAHHLKMFYFHFNFINFKDSLSSNQTKH